jgi:hypothetical protein
MRGSRRFGPPRCKRHQSPRVVAGATIAWARKSATPATVIGLDVPRLLQCADMADWRQIQARIRKAKNSPEAVSKLSELFKRTHDGMVAWELGSIEEKADHKEEAGNWYILAAQRFRRADWKKKAEEALTRLGVPLPQAEAAILTPPETPAIETESTPTTPSPREIPTESSSPVEPASDSPAIGETGRRKRRRGRRGGRGRRRQGADAQGLPAEAFAEHPSSPTQPETTTSPIVERRASSRPEREAPAAEPLRPVSVEPPPQLPSERMAHGRSEPGLASRMAHLESVLRRLLGSPLRRLDNTDEAPAGPGVFLLSDSDQITSYYVESCQTLRVGIGNLVRGGHGGKTGRTAGHGPSDTSLKAKLAEHLGINEAKVSQYMKDHCVIRWIQLDDDAPLLAHFAIAVLRTPLNLG